MPTITQISDLRNYRSGEEEGWISEDDIRTHFKNRRNEH